LRPTMRILVPFVLLLLASATLAYRPVQKIVFPENEETLPSLARILNSERLPPFNGSPPHEIPEDLLEAFTRNGTIPAEYDHVDDSDEVFEFSRSFIDELVTSAREQMRRGPAATGEDFFLYSALRKHSIRNKVVLVVGSASPWYEALCLMFGVEKVITVDYNKLSYDHPNIVTLQPDQLETYLSEKDITIGAAVSTLTLDKDGLGRYGHPVAPDGDLLTMDWLRSILSTDAQLFLSVPIGPDTLIWNKSRRYGVKRLPLLLEGWKQVEVIGWEAERLTGKAENEEEEVYRPVIVLQPDSEPVASQTSAADADIEVSSKDEL